MNWFSFLFSALQAGAQQAAIRGDAQPEPARKRLRNSRRLAWVGVVILLMGLGSGAWGAWEIGSGVASAAWPGVPGRITESGVVMVPGPYAETPHAIIRYEYRVGGRRYVGKRVSFRGKGDPERLASKYRAGARVTVYHDPDDPSNAALEVGMDWGDLVRMAVIAGALPGAGLLVLWMAARTRKDALCELGLLQPKQKASDSSLSELQDDNPYRHR